MPAKLVLTALAVALLSVAVALARTTPAQLRAEPVTALKATVLADTHGRTLYRLKPETPHHLLCRSSSCTGVWPPLTVASRKAKVKLPKGMTGAVSLIARGKRFQVVVRGVPVYRFAGDSAAKQANGQGIKSFGGKWGTIAVRKKKAAAPAPAPPVPGY